jgi:hypothetical protein
MRFVAGTLQKARQYLSAMKRLDRKDIKITAKGRWIDETCDDETQAYFSAPVLKIGRDSVTVSYGGESMKLTPPKGEYSTHGYIVLTATDDFDN